MDTDPIATRACEFRRNILRVGDTFPGAGTSTGDGLVNAEVDVDLGGAGNVWNRETASRDALPNGTVTAPVASATGDRLVPTTNRGVATIHSAGIAIVTVANRSGLTSSAAAMIVNSACIVVVASDRGGPITAGSLGATAGAVVNPKAGGRGALRSRWRVAGYRDAGACSILT